MLKTMLVLAVVFVAGVKSDPIGVYALIDRVVLEPAEGKPTRIQIWGSFSVAKGKFGSEYERPVRGYLYFSIDPKKPDDCRNEWSDLRSVAGTGQGVAFASRYSAMGRLRPATEQPKEPDVYPLEFGIQRTNGGPAALLRLHPAPLHPSEGQEVDPGPIKLIAQNVADKTQHDLFYVFELEDGTGAKERSLSVPAGQRETAWSPKSEIKAGERYTWRVWVVGKELIGPVASASFKGKK
jgi:hypothetical protein